LPNFALDEIFLDWRVRRAFASEKAKLLGDQMFRYVLSFLIAIFVAAPAVLQAVPESELAEKQQQVAQFMSENFVVSTFQGYGNKRLSWGLIPGDKTLPPIVISVGLGESYKHYEEFLYDFWSDGTNKQSVFIFDLRSQGFSDRTSEDLTVMHVDSFDDYVNDLEIFFDTVVRPEYPVPARVMGHSTGGMIALLVLAKRSDLAEKAIFVAPLFGLNYGSVPSWVIETYAGFLEIVGFHAKPIPFRGSSSVVAFKNNKFTSSEIRFNRIQAVQEILPKPVPSGPSVGFVISTQAAMVKAKKIAPNFNLPVELLTSDKDVYVNTNTAIELCKLMPNCNHKPYTNTLHVMLHERDDIRTSVMATLNDFLVVDKVSAAGQEK
jgi:lysophospholipase